METSHFNKMHFTNKQNKIHKQKVESFSFSFCITNHTIFQRGNARNIFHLYNSMLLNFMKSRFNT